MNDSGSLQYVMKEVTNDDSWGYGLHHFKFQEYLEEGEAVHRSLFSCSHKTRLWKLTQEIYWAASTDQGHLELEGFEWLILSAPWRLTRLFFHDVTRHLNTLKLKLRWGSGEHCWCDQGNTSVLNQTGHVNQATGDCIHFPQLTRLHSQWNHWITKSEDFINQFQKKFTDVWKKESHFQCGCLWSASLWDGPQLAWFTFSWTKCTGDESKMWATKSQYSWQSKDEFKKVKAILKHMLNSGTCLLSLMLWKHSFLGKGWNNTGATIHDVSQESWELKYA